MAVAYESALLVAAVRRLRGGKQGQRGGLWIERPGTEFRFDRQVVIDGLHQILPRTEIALGGLDGGVAEQQLDLLEIAAGAPAQLRAGPPQIVWREAGLAETG